MLLVKITILFFPKRKISRTRCKRRFARNSTDKENGDIEGDHLDIVEDEYEPVIDFQWNSLKIQKFQFGSQESEN